MGRALWGQIARTGKTRTRAYIEAPGRESTRAKEDPMAFKPNYGRDRAERERAARARTEEKQKKKEEKLAQRKAERDAAQAPPDEGKADGEA